MPGNFKLFAYFAIYTYLVHSRNFAENTLHILTKAEHTFKILTKLSLAIKKPWKSVRNGIPRPISSPGSVKTLLEDNQPADQNTTKRPISRPGPVKTLPKDQSATKRPISY